MVERKCLFCRNTFKIRPSALKRGRGKYCSKDCYSKAQKENFDNLAKFMAPAIMQILENANNSNEDTEYSEYYVETTGERGFEKEIIVGGKSCFIRKEVRKSKK